MTTDMTQTTQTPTADDKSNRAKLTKLTLGKGVQRNFGVRASTPTAPAGMTGKQTYSNNSRNNYCNNNKRNNTNNYLSNNRLHHSINNDNNSKCVTRQLEQPKQSGRQEAGHGQLKPHKTEVEAELAEDHEAVNIDPEGQSLVVPEETRRLEEPLAPPTGGQSNLNHLA